MNKSVSLAEVLSSLIHAYFLITMYFHVLTKKKCCKRNKEHLKLQSSLFQAQIVGEDAKEKGRQKVGGAGKRKRKSFHLFSFRVCLFSIQQTRLSQSLEQANF